MLCLKAVSRLEHLRKAGSSDKILDKAGHGTLLEAPARAGFRPLTCQVLIDNFWSEVASSLRWASKLDGCRMDIDGLRLACCKLLINPLIDIATRSKDATRGS